MLFVSIGCPASIGPEVSVAAARTGRFGPCVLVGSQRALERAAELVGFPRERLRPFVGGKCPRGGLTFLDPGPPLRERDLDPERATPAAGLSQLLAIEAAFEHVRATPHNALVTGPVSKARIAQCGHPGSERFRGHTEWLQERDRASRSVMCFVAPTFATSLVTTHIPLAEVSEALTPEGVSDAIVHLARMLARLGSERPRVAVCSLNPHAGESALLGDEELRTIAPGIRAAKRRLRGEAEVSPPLGAESAYRLAHAGHFAGVVAMYHDQATVPCKLVAFGKTVNVTLGLSRIRTSVDHGTAYDIAWQGCAEPSGMKAALALASRLVGKPSDAARKPAQG